MLLYHNKSLTTVYEQYNFFWTDFQYMSPLFLAIILFYKILAQISTWCDIIECLLILSINGNLILKQFSFSLFSSCVIYLAVYSSFLLFSHSLSCIIPVDDLSNFLTSDGLLFVLVGSLLSAAVWRLFVVDTRELLMALPCCKVFLADASSSLTFL